MSASLLSDSASRRGRPFSINPSRKRPCLRAGGRRSASAYSYALFSANVIVTSDEQPDSAELGEQQPLRKLPRLFAGERQLPAGEGEPPPSEPSLPGMEPDLPALAEPADREPMEVAQSVGSITDSLLGRLR